MRTHTQAVHEQFDPKAGAYLTSTVHAAGPDLRHAHKLVACNVPCTGAVLDIGTGAGHLSFALAPLVRRVVALDPCAEMLATARQVALERGLGQIETCLGAAAPLPFADATFELVATRYSAHHWLDIPQALAEMRRVVKPGGFVLVIDVLADDHPLVDTHLQSVELLRDASHVRNRSSAEWQSMLRTAGFAQIERGTWDTRLEFTAWVQRMGTPDALVTAIRMLQHGAPVEVQRALRIEIDGSFTARTGLFWGGVADYT